MIGFQNGVVRLVEALEIPAIVGEYTPTQRVCASQDVSVGSSDATIVLRGQDIVPKAPKFLDRRKREIFVGVQEHSASRHEAFFTGFVSPNGVVDLSRVLRRVRKR